MHVWLASHAVAFCQAPRELQVCGCEAVAHCVWPGPQTPEHAPATQVVLESQTLPFACQVPDALHVTGC